MINPNSDITQSAPQTPAPEAEQVERKERRLVFRPLADVTETDKGIMIAVEMPGVGPEGVEVELEKRVLTIRGRRSPRAPEGWRRVHREFAEGDYMRAFDLSVGVDPDSIVAVMRDGVLTLELSRRERAGPRRIDVAAA